MKKYNRLYYVLFILLIMGAFASMAQNGYGLTITGAVAFIFGLVFLIEFITLVRRKNGVKASSLLEPGCLFIIAVILGFRVFYIYFLNIEWIFGAAVTILIFFYFSKMVSRFRYYQKKDKWLAVLAIAFHLSIIFFLSSFALLLFAPSVAEVTGVVAMAFLLFFIVGGFLRKQVLIDGNNLSAFKMVTGFRDHSIILTTFFLLVSVYFGLNRVGVLPAIYSDEYPQAYFELINQPTARREKTANGEYKYQDFLKKYKEFLKHNSGNAK